MIFKGCGSPKLVADLGSTLGGPSTGFMMERLTNMKAFQSKANLPHADSRNYTGLNIFGEGGGGRDPVQGEVWRRPGALYREFPSLVDRLKSLALPFRWGEVGAGLHPPPEEDLTPSKRNPRSATVKTKSRLHRCSVTI